MQKRILRAITSKGAIKKFNIAIAKQDCILGEKILFSPIVGLLANVCIGVYIVCV